MGERQSEPIATVRDVRRAMWTVIAVVAIATVLLMLTMKYSSPEGECRFLADRVTGGSGTEAEFERWDRLGCGRKGF